MTTNKLLIVGNQGLLDFCLKIQEAVLEGWRVVADNPPNQYGWLYDIELVRDDSDTLPIEIKKAPGRPPKK